MHNKASGTEELHFALQLPALPQALLHLLDACNNPDRDILKISTIVARDVMISAKILRLANSAFLGARTKFVNIEQAVIYLGIDTVRNLAISVAIHETFAGHPRSHYLQLEELWHHSLFTALLAKEIAQLSGYPNPSETYLAGFLHDIGKYLLIRRFGEEYARLLKTHEDGLELLHQERNVLGMTHTEAGVRLIEHWNLEPSFAQAIARHHFAPTDLPKEQPVVRITALAHSLVDCQGFETAIGPAAKLLQVSPETLAILRSDQLKTVEMIAESLGIPAFVQPPPEQSQPTESQADGRPGGLRRDDLLRERVHSLAQVSGLLDNLTRAKTLNRTFLVLEESLQVLFDFDRAILLLPDEKNIRFSVHGSYRNRFARSLQDLGLIINDSSILEFAIRNRQVTYLERRHIDAAKEAEWKIFEALDEECLLAVPFSIGESQSGILLIAAPGSAGAISTGTAATLLHLSSHIGSRLLLENIKNRQAEALAEERVAAVDGIARTLAHEIANPLSIIGNYVALLGNGESCQQTVREDLAIISGELERIGRIIRQLNELSTPPQPSDLVPVDLHLLVSETLKLFDQSTRLRKDISITYHGDPRIPNFQSKPDSLRQILINLLGNSVDAVGRSGWIRVASHYHPTGILENLAEADRITITVSDSGPGIDPAIADRLFKAGHSTKGDGHIGLGLAIVKKLATDLQGKISQGSGETGETVFILDLPVPPGK